MQSKFISKWNAAMSILEKKTAKKLIHLNNDGVCAGFSSALLDYASRADLATFYDYINFITTQSPEKIAEFLESKSSKESQLANRLFRFVGMLALLQENQSVKTVTHQGSLRSANAQRINYGAKGKTSAEVLTNVTSALELLKKLSVNEGMILGAEGHAYAIYRTENTWIIFDSNDRNPGAGQEFKSINRAARKLADVVDTNVESYALSKMSETRQVFQLIFNIFAQFINLFRRDKRLLSPVALAATHVQFPKAIKAQENSDANSAIVAHVPHHSSSHSQIMAQMKGTGNAQVLALRAIEANDADLLEQIVSKYALDVNQPWQVWHADKNNTLNPLKMAIRSNSLRVVEKLIALGSDVNLQDDEGNSLLLLAVEQQNTELAQLLLEKHANPDLANKNGASPLTVAIKQQNHAMVALLLKHNANPDQSSKEVTPLLLAASKQDTTTLEMLLKKGANPDVFYKDHISPLTLSIEKENASMVKMLLEHHANPNLQDDKGCTALMQAIIVENEELVSLLVSHDADPSVCTLRGGYSARDLAVHSKNNAIINLLSGDANNSISKVNTSNSSENSVQDEVNPSVLVLG